MGFGDFQLNNNGKKEVLQNAKKGVRKEQVDKKFHNLFDAYDFNQDGTLETNELNEIFNGLSSFAGDDKVLDTAENQLMQSVFAEKMNIQNADFMGFVKSVSTASADIIETKEKQTPDGGKEVTTTYNDGTTETIAFYSNGDYKWKKTEKRTLETSFELIIDGKKYKFNDETKFKKALEKAEQKNIDSANINRQNEQAKKLSEGKLVTVKKLPISKIETKSSSNENIDRKESYSPRFIAETLGVNVATEDGKKVVERLSQLPQETLEKLKDGKELKELISSQELEPTFDNISNILEITEGVTLRNEEEYKASEAQRQEILTQIKAANFMANVYETLASYNDEYTDSVGLFGLGSEGIGYVLNKLGLDGENHYQFADSCREWAKNSSELKVLNPQKFKEGFKKIYGETADKNGIDYNSDAFKKCFALAESGKAFDKDNKMTDEYKESILKAMNIVADDPNDSTFNQVMNGFGEALIMIATLGWGAETKAGATLATTTMGTFSKAGVAIASKQVNNKLLQGALRLSGQAVKLVGPALNEGTKMYLYTTAEGTVMNVSNRAVKQDGFDKLLDTQAQVMTNAEGSFTFGAFAGVFGSTVTQKVMQRASKVASKVTTTLSEKFSQGAVSANEVFTTILEKSAPTKIAEVAAFATDVIGFTAFESALSIANTLQREGALTPEKLVDTLMEEFGHQGYSLGQIKIISHLIMMLTGSRSARMQSQKYLQENLPQLKGATVDWVNGGKDGFKINLPDGRKIECKNASEMISAHYLMVRGETAFSSKFDKANGAKAETKNTPHPNPLPQGAREQSGVRTNEAKAPYIQPETVKKDFTTSDHIMTSDVAAETAVPKANTILDKKFDETTIPQAKTILKELGFSKEEIATIDLKNADAQRFLEVVHNAVKYEPRLRENFDNEELLESLKDKELLKEFLEEEGKYFTNENCELLAKQVIFDKNGGLSKIFSDYSNPEILIKLLPVLTQNGKHKVIGSELQRLGYHLDKADNLAKITPKNVDFIYKINEKIENKNYALELRDILDLEDTTPEFINNYVKETNRFAKYELSDTYGSNLTEKLNKHKAVSDFLEEYPMNLTVKDAMTGKDTKLSPETILKLSQTTDKSVAQKFVNSLSKEVKAGVASYMGFVEKGFPAEKLTDLLNTVCKKDFGEIEGGIRPLIKKMLETGSTDYDGMVKLIKSYKDTKCLSWYGNERFVQVANGDYTGAAKYIELAKELKMDEEHFGSLLNDENADFKSTVECLTYIKENNIDISTYYDYKLLRDKNWKENIAKIEYLKQQGAKCCNDLYLAIDYTWKSNLTFKEFKSKYEFVSKNDYINNHIDSDFMQSGGGFYTKTKIASTDLSLQEIKELTLLAQNNHLRKDGILELLGESNKLKYDLAKKIATDTDFSESAMSDVLRTTNKNNITLSEKLCANKEFPIGCIADILRRTDEKNIEKVTNICQNYMKYGISPKQINRLIPVINDIKLENIATIRENVSETLFEKLSANDFVVLTNNTKLLNITSIEILQKSEKYDFINFLLANKNDICNNKMNRVKEAIPIMPVGEKEYASVMKYVAESLNISFDKLTPDKQVKFDNSISSLSNSIKEINLTDLSEINLKYSQKEFVNDINELLKDLSVEEQIKLQSKFGFRIIDENLTGYPKTVKDMNAIEFSNKELLNKVNEKVDSFLNNNALTVKNNPQLNSMLNDLFYNCPEILNQIDGSTEFAKTIKRLQTIANREEFKALSDSDKKIIVLATLIENTDKSINTAKDAAFDAFFIGQKYGLSDNDATKLYHIIEAGNNVETFMNTTKAETNFRYRGQVITGQDRQNKFDMMALNLKKDNRLQMAQMLYSSKYPEGFTRNFDKALENRVNEIKSQDFILPQTPSETYQNYAAPTEISRGDNKYNVNVVKAKDIPNMYAFVHTPEAGFATGGSRAANFANFEAFATLNDNKVICTSYVSADKAGLVKEFHNGFIFEVQNDKQYIAYGRDIFSLGKNIQDIVIEYYRDKGFKAGQNKGDKYDHRTLMSNIMKQMLFGKDYYKMSKDIIITICNIKNKYASKLQSLKNQRQSIIKKAFGTDNITNAQYQELKSNADFVNIEKQMKDLKSQELAEIENIPEYKELKDMDNKYIARLDNVKAKLGDKPMTLDNIRTIDTELADAYKAFLDKDGANKTENDNSASLLRSSWHNEALVSNPKITGIFTDNIDRLPEEYLLKAQEENLPIVIFDI